MSTPVAIGQAGGFWMLLVTAAARTTVLAAVAGLLMKAFRVKAASARVFTWKAVLFAGLNMPLLTLLAPSIPIFVPALVSGSSSRTDTALSAGSTAQNAGQTMQRLIQMRSQNVQVDQLPAEQHNAGTDQTSTGIVSTARVIAVASLIYLLVAIFLFSRLMIALVFARRLVRSAHPIRDLQMAAPSWVWPGIREIPVCESALVYVPVTVGLFAPTILLPSTWREWDEANLQSVLNHELSHAARLDGLSRSASLLHRAIFWFSPLAWWLNRQISELAEEVSDEAALSAGAERNQYARNLLGFFYATQGTAGRVRWQGASMATSGMAERRVEKILSWRGDTKMRVKKWMIVVIAVGMPAAYLIAAARPVQNEQPGSPTQEQTSTPPAADSSSQGNASAPSAPPSSRPEVSSPSSAVQRSSTHHGHGYFYSYGSDDEQRFVIVSGKMDGFTMSGSSEDARHAENLKKQISGDFIWFERDEKPYIIRDQATVDRARQLWAPQEELGKKQAELGKQQEALGKQQEELGARMQQVRVKVPDMTAELDKLKAELRQLGPNASMEQIGQIQSEIGELQSKIGELQSHAGDAQGKLGEEMGALGEQQGKLGEQQGELGRQQGELAEKANKEMKRLLDDAIKNGTAQPESQTSGGASL